METKQKIKQIIILSVIITLISITCIFNRSINSFLIKLLQNEFDIIFVEDNLLVHFINVGQGDAVAINLPNNEIMLIDCGPESHNIAYTQYLRENVLNSKNSNVVDYLILTHADSDHLGGALKLLDSYKIKKIYLPVVSSNSATYQELLTAVKKMDCEIISKSTEFEIDECAIEIMGLYGSTNTNESSTIINLNYKNKSFLFMADATIEVENMLIKEYGTSLNCDVLKVGHHGSSGSTSLEFLETTLPQYAVISVGTNSYGHPTDMVLSNLNRVNAEVLRTDIDGNILFAVNDIYNLTCKYSGYVVSGFDLDYKNFVLIIDFVLFFKISLIIVKIIKNSKQNNK